MNGWHPFDNGQSLGQMGSEDGVILRDEQHDDGARITLERDGHTPFAITCGIYDWLVHTCFFADEYKARTAFESMRDELTEILNLIPDADEPAKMKIEAASNAMTDFVARYS